MGSRGLHVLMGGAFHHAHQQCTASCVNFLPRFDGWHGGCLAREKILCCAKTRKRPCKLFAPAEAVRGTAEAAKEPTT